MYQRIDPTKPIKRFLGWNIDIFDECEEKDEPRVKSKKIRNKYKLGQAVRMVLKNSKKALSSLQIWNEIQKLNLYKTNCQTPKNSVSAHITENIRKFGNNSAFIRKEQGLYILRK